MSSQNSASVEFMDAFCASMDENISLEKLCGKSKLIETNIILKFYMPDVLLLE